MQSRLAKLVVGVGRKSPSPSVILTLGEPSSVHALHIVPEEGVAEQFEYSCTGRTTIRYNGATETSRERLGVVLLHVCDGELTRHFLEEVSARAIKLLEDSTIEGDRISTIAQVLRSTALERSQAREGRPPPRNAAQHYPIYLVNINRARPGKIVTNSDPKSIEN